MAIPGHEKLTIDEFFDAISGSEGRYELVGGIAYAMAGAKEGHNVICSNVQTAFVPAGKQKGCRTTSSDTAVQTGPDTVRYPDVVVDCGPPNAAAMIASKPTIIVEVSSPGTAVFDYGAKLPPGCNAGQSTSTTAVATRWNRTRWILQPVSKSAGEHWHGWVIPSVR
jgi:Uma2 family endonuclease